MRRTIGLTRCRTSIDQRVISDHIRNRSAKLHELQVALGSVNIADLCASMYHRVERVHGALVTLFNHMPEHFLCLLSITSSGAGFDQSTVTQVCHFERRMEQVLRVESVYHTFVPILHEIIDHSADGTLVRSKSSVHQLLEPKARAVVLLSAAIRIDENVVGRSGWLHHGGQGLHPLKPLIGLLKLSRLCIRTDHGIVCLLGGLAAHFQHGRIPLLGSTGVAKLLTTTDQRCERRRIWLDSSREHFPQPKLSLVHVTLSLVQVNY
mmetsp:Transcript_45999/g.86233  ORF Transcript_45999/g.86233 Transcript_45999/m.86233 type:complete len:265 (+) Transcript_45999:647-1441(+)